ncbi:MAG: hypothetical protein ACJZ14_00155 [Candidatus Neomarinimicrobiota bacterium]
MIKYLIILLLPIWLIGQTSIETLIKKSGFYFEDLKMQISSDTLDNFKTSQLEVNELKIKLSDLESYYNTNNAEKVYDFKIKGPDLSIKKLSLKGNRILNNWVISERINQLKKRESVAKNNLLIIRDAVLKYEVDNLKLPNSLDQLSINNYLDLKRGSFINQHWNYSLNLPESILSEPSSINPFSENKVVIYDWIQKDFSINPELDSLENLTRSEWIIKLNIESINNLLSSIIHVKTNLNTTNYHLQINKGDFEINELIFDAIPDQSLTQLTKIEIPKLKVQLSDLVLDIDLEKKVVLNRGKVNFKIQNFEIKFPSELREEPRIQQILEQFGIWNNSLLIKELNIFLNIINENTAEIELFFNAPFMKINLMGGLSINQTISLPQISLKQMKVEIKPISFGLKTFIKNWEENHKTELERDNGIIILDLEGLIDNPSIRNLEKPITLLEISMIKHHESSRFVKP